jgi:hypothetical protein
MNRKIPLAAFALLSLLTIAPLVRAQAVAAPNAAAAARLAKLKARQDAIIAAARAQAVAPPVVTAAPVVATAVPAATAAPKATTTAAIAAPATSSSVKPVTSAVAPAASAAHIETAAIALDLDALKKTRPDRRHAEFLDLQARFGGLLSDPRAIAELKQHAQRVAYLQRIRALGVKANDANFVKGVDALITTEEERDANALNALRTGALPVATAVPAVATAVAVPVTAAPAAGATK